MQHDRDQELLILRLRYLRAGDPVFGRIVDSRKRHEIERRRPQTEHRPLGHPHIVIVELGDFLDPHPAANRTYRNVSQRIDDQQTARQTAARLEIGIGESIRVVPYGVPENGFNKDDTLPGHCPGHDRHRAVRRSAESGAA